MRVAPLAVMMLLPLALVASPAVAADAAEIAFWESVRDSKDATELRAYLERYPNGDFAVLARKRLAALGTKPSSPTGGPYDAPAVASTAPTAAPGAPHAPQVGDSWMYTLSHPRLRGQWGRPTRPTSTHAIAVGSVADGQIVDSLAIDGGTPVSVTHSSTPTLLVQGASIFSPYLPAEHLAAQGRLATIDIREPRCATTYACQAKGRIWVTETVQVPAGQFVATRIVVEQEWRPRSGFGANLMGSRRLTIWYAPEIGRAVKYSSRLVVGNSPPMDADFDLELVSYQLK